MSGEAGEGVFQQAQNKIYPPLFETPYPVPVRNKEALSF
jgi:hypothetical protein